MIKENTTNKKIKTTTPLPREVWKKLQDMKFDLNISQTQIIEALIIKELVELGYITEDNPVKILYDKYLLEKEYFKKNKQLKQLTIEEAMINDNPSNNKGD